MPCHSKEQTIIDGEWTAYVYWDWNCRSLYEKSDNTYWRNHTGHHHPIPTCYSHHHAEKCDTAWRDPFPLWCHQRLCWRRLCQWCRWRLHFQLPVTLLGNMPRCPCSPLWRWQWNALGVESHHCICRKHMHGCGKVKGCYLKKENINNTKQKESSHLNHTTLNPRYSVTA